MASDIQEFDVYIMARLKFIVASLLLVLCFSALAQDKRGVADSVARSRALEYHYLQARSYMEQDSFDCCYELLEHCHALDPTSLTVMYDLASFYTFLNKDSIAHGLLCRIVDADPSNVHYNNALISYYLKVGDLKAAIKVYEKLIDISASKDEIYRELYMLYSECGEHGKAIGVLDELEKLEGANEDFKRRKVRHYAELGDSAMAVEVVLGLIKETPDDMQNYRLLGDVYSVYGNRGKALENYRKVLSINPDDVYALSALAEFYAGNNDSLYFNTVERLLVSEELDPQSRVGAIVQYIKDVHPKDSVRVREYMRHIVALPFDEFETANVYSHYLKFVNAPADTIVPVLEKMHSLEPDNLPVIMNLLEYAIERNDIEAVFQYADNAQPYCPEKLEIYYYKGLSSYMLGRKHESVAIYKEGLERCSDETSPEILSTVYAVLGDTYHELDMMDSCMQAYDSALVYDGNNVGVLNNYAYFLALDGKRLDRALEMIRKAVSLRQDDVMLLDTYAWVLFKLERYEEAKAYAEKLISLGGESSSDVFHHCGDIYAKCGDIEQAVRYWIKAQAAGDDSKILAKKIHKRKYYNDAKLRK